MTALEATFGDLALDSGLEAQQVDHDHAPDGLTCAICLEQCAPEDIAMVKGCEHLYCVCCILKWACTREVATCPQCKMPFSYLWTYRMLDGSISDFPMEESLCLLKRAAWFTDHVRVSEFGPKMSAAAAAGDDFDGYEEEFDEEEEIENYYFSSAAGRARIVIGNRRWGENGSVRSGRMYARPVASPAHAPAAKSGDKIGKAGKSSASSSVKGPSAGAGPSAAGTGAGSSKELSSSAAVATATPVTPAPGSSCTAASVVQTSCATQQQGAGRRAKRAARRRTADEEDDGGDPYDKYYDGY